LYVFLLTSLFFLLCCVPLLPLLNPSRPMQPLSRLATKCFPSPKPNPQLARRQQWEP
jgi:hypothetical protein